MHFICDCKLKMLKILLVGGKIKEGNHSNQPTAGEAKDQPI